jgi:hypothetical protein
MLLRSSIDSREFIEVAKIAFVEVATDEYGIRDRKTNISRVSILTGFTRKEVKRIRENIDDGEPLRDVKEPMYERMLSGWQKDADFIDAKAHPKRLAYDGPGATFLTLFHRYCGDLPVGAMRKEMLRMGRVKEDKDGMLMLNKEQLLTRSKVKRIEEAMGTLSLAGRAVEEGATGSGSWPMTVTLSNAMHSEDRNKVKNLAGREMKKTSKLIKNVLDAYDHVSDPALKERKRAGLLQLYVETEIES